MVHPHTAAGQDHSDLMDEIEKAAELARDAQRKHRANDEGNCRWCFPPTPWPCDVWNKASRMLTSLYR